jgi:hypothetical protein
VGEQAAVRGWSGRVRCAGLRRLERAKAEEEARQAAAEKAAVRHPGSAIPPRAPPVLPAAIRSLPNA